MTNAKRTTFLLSTVAMLAACSIGSSADEGQVSDPSLAPAPRVEVEPLASKKPARCRADSDCASPDACHVASCDRRGTCVVQNAPDGTACNDGNATTTNDVCTAGVCKGTAPPPPSATCGNGIVEPGEACDDGNTVDETSCPYGMAYCGGCNSQCTAVILGLVGPYCGDGLVSNGEVCDDVKRDGTCGSCLADCSAPAPCTGAVCGNGIVEAGEECEPPNATPVTECPYGMANCGTCGPTCQVIFLTGGYCGDGIVNGPEVCDDGKRDGSCGSCLADCSAPGPCP